MEIDRRRFKKKTDISNDEKLNIKYSTERSGTLKFMLSYVRTIVTEFGQEGKVVTTNNGEISFTREVEAGNEYSIALQTAKLPGEYNWGTLVILFE